MSDSVEIIKQRIAEKHSGDEKQLEVVFSPSPKLLVEAPAGYGKTKTMVSRIAFMLATNQIPYPKRLLALTFSVNAAYKIKKDVSQQIPGLLKNKGSATNLNEKIFVSNYHGFCRSVLKKHGYKIHDSLLEIDKLETMDESDLQKQAGVHLSVEAAEILFEYSKAIKEINKKEVKDNLNKYCEAVVREVLPSKFITFNAILALTIKLFIDHPNIKDFYNKYFSVVIIDEYQDTNLLSYWLIIQLISEKTKAVFLGDSLQRIYGFIGAVPNLLDTSEKKFGLTKISLNKNHRFSTNPEMLNLDANIRKNAENPVKPSILEVSHINLILYDNQDTEALGVLSKVSEITTTYPDAKIAVLVKQRGANVDKIIETFRTNNVRYFYGLFTDEDSAYVKFHRKCLSGFIELISANEQITKKLSLEHKTKIISSYGNQNDEVVVSLLSLLEIFWKKMLGEARSLTNHEKIALIKETFEHNGLKQYIEFVGANIVFSTVHAAKGLEWDFVILPDMEQDSFPNWWGLCQNCMCKKDCRLAVSKNNEKDFLEELSVFYVAITRARKQVHFSASSTQLDKYKNPRSKNLSCFLKLPGISIEES